MSSRQPVRGFVDRRKRPLLGMQGNEGQRFIALVDTGFNAAFWCGSQTAGWLNFVPTGKYARVVTAGGRHRAELAHGYIKWLGELREIVALVKSNESMPLHPNEPSALIGTQLLFPGRLLIDFLEERVEISP